MTGSFFKASQSPSPYFFTACHATGGLLRAGYKKLRICKEMNVAYRVDTWIQELSLQSNQQANTHLIVDLVRGSFLALRHHFRSSYLG